MLVDDKQKISEKLKQSNTLIGIKDALVANRECLSTELKDLLKAGRERFTRSSKTKDEELKEQLRQKELEMVRLQKQEEVKEAMQDPKDPEEDDTALQNGMIEEERLQEVENLQEEEKVQEDDKLPDEDKDAEEEKKRN